MRPRAAGRGERGIALVMVVVVLVALAIIATPFAMSMRGMEASALLSFQQEAARADALLVLAAAESHLENTHPFLDTETPWSDGADELMPPDLASRHPRLMPRDPKGTVASVSIADESGKVHLGTASPYLLGNLLGGRATLAETIDERATLVPLTDSNGFLPAGLVWVGRELIEYSLLQSSALDECRRGVPSANLAGSSALPHPAGDDVLDLRLLLLAEHGWRIRPGIFDLFRRADGLKDIGLYGELSYQAEDIDRVRPYLSVARGAPSWRDRQTIRGTATALDGGVELLVDDGSRCGQGTIVELRDGQGAVEWNLVLSAADWGDRWHVELLEPPTLAHDDGRSELRTLVREPVNVADAAPAVLEALLTGLGRNPVADVINEREAGIMATILIGVDLSSDSSVLRPAFAGSLERGDIGPLDLIAAGVMLESERLQPGQVDEAELAARLTGQVSRRSSQRISRSTAQDLARRIRLAQPGSHEDLRHALDVALTDGVLTEDQRDLVLRNAADSNDALLVGGTAPFSYSSAGIFALEAAVSRNLKNGREQARAHVTEVVSVAPSGESARIADTQRAFEELRPLGLGWTSFPELLLSGPGRALAATPLDAAGLLADPTATAESATDLVADLSAAQGLATVEPSRAGTLIGGRPGASTSREASFVAPAPVRSALPDTLHFDEGGEGLTGSSPRGFSFAAGAVTMPVAGLRPDLDGSAEWNLIDGFTVEFWFELADVDAETILFDAGTGELENRILIAMQGRQLVLRVDDTGIPDFEAVMPEGHAPPGGEIRYAFDDGLALLPGVPYHVAAQIGGARDSQLALFVDGVPRGRRSFCTSLLEDVPASSGQVQGVVGYGQETKLRVESTAGFPDRGALRIGQEIVEYVQKQPDAFLVRPGGPGDPFGGRGRRDTIPLDHPASELVELVGWTRPLYSERAATGQVVLASPIDKFGLAELDPTALIDEISIEITPLQGPTFLAPLGTGLVADATEIPLRATGALELEADTFQTSGGFAILFCDYGGDDLAGQTVTFTPPTGGGSVQVTLIAQTEGGWLGGAECIRYSGFDGTRLTGVQRNQSGLPTAAGGPPSDLLTKDAVSSVNTGSTSWNEPREYVTTFDDEVLGSLPNLPANPRVLVFPISVGVSGSNLFDDFHPLPKRPGPAESVLLQIGQDFVEGPDSTEWVRWDTATTTAFVRDDIDAINDALSHVITIEAWNPDTVIDDSERKLVNDELDFRGQDGTVDERHGNGDPAGRVLPVHVLGDPTLVPLFDVVSGLPGRHDALTLIDPETELKEWHRVNWATTSDMDWGSYGLVGLRDRVSGDFQRYDQRGEGKLKFDISDDLLDDEFDEADSSGRRMIESLNADMRLVTRMLCKPSGELPSGPIDTVHLGADYSGRASPGGATVDELRFHRALAPGQLLPNTARYVLKEDLELEEERQLTLAVEALQFPYALRQNPILGADVLGILGVLPQQGGLLRVGEEIVGYAGLDPVDSGNVFLVARGLYGTMRAFHRQGEPVVPLLFWPAAPLSGQLSETGAVIPLADETAGFPAEGGMLLIGEELVGYTRRVGPELLMPVRPGGSSFDSQGLLRGRFGSKADAHPPGTIARWFPERVVDRALLGSDVPESESLQLPLRAPAAWWTDLAVEAFLPLPGMGLEVRAVLDGQSSPHADALTAPGLLAAGARSAAEPSTRILLPVRRQADRLDVCLFAVWEPFAFDGRRYASNAWKLVPEVRSVVAGHLQPTLVLEHEEWR